MKNNAKKTTYVVVKHSREYSSGQLEHLASYFDDESEANAAADQANADAWEKLADNLGVENTEEWRTSYKGTSPACWLVVTK